MSFAGRCDQPQAECLDNVKFGNLLLFPEREIGVQVRQTDVRVLCLVLRAPVSKQTKPVTTRQSSLSSDINEFS